MGTSYNPTFTDIAKGLATLIPILIMSVFLAFLPAEENNVILELDPVTTESTGISLIYTNNTNRRISEPPVVESVEKKVGDDWVAVDCTWGKSEAVAGSIPPKGKTESFGWISTKLSAGEYRITISYGVGPGVFTKATTGYTSANFTVTEAE